MKPYTEEFLSEAKRMEEAGTLNMYVAEAIRNRVSAKALERELKLAIRKPGEYLKQPGSSHIHAAVQAACWTLLGLARKEGV